jgi:hypothetical protein
LKYINRICKDTGVDYVILKEQPEKHLPAQLEEYPISLQEAAEIYKQHSVSTNTHCWNKVIRSIFIENKQEECFPEFISRLSHFIQQQQAIRRSVVDQQNETAAAANAAIEQK